MFGRNCILFCLSAVAALGCGDLDVYNYGADDTGMDPMDAGVTQSDGGSDEPDGGVSGADLATADVRMLDMELPEPDPTMNVPQTGPTVEEQILTECSTIAVKGLSLQLIDQMNCEEPGIMKSFEGADGISYGPVVFPFQQGPATDTLTDVAANNAGTMPINSALRTLPQQYLLYEWYQRGLCNANLAASPGRSNHNGGLAVDIGNSNAWRSAMRNAGYVDNVSGEPWHFYYSSGRDVRSLSVLAFQKLYNRNFPEDPITEDGIYGPETAGALASSPANGFTAGPRCEAVQAMVAFPHRAPLDVAWEHAADNLIAVRTTAPSGIRLVEYFVDGELVGYSDQGEGARFETVLELPRGRKLVELEIVAYDASGTERANARGLVDVEGPFFVRPMGGPNYIVGVDDLPNGVRKVRYLLDGERLRPDRHLRIARGTEQITTQLFGAAEITAEFLDRHGDVVRRVTGKFRVPGTKK
jgi:hypothetical protein